MQDQNAIHIRAGMTFSIVDRTNETTLEALPGFLHASKAAGRRQQKPGRHKTEKA
jgi:hypothetical protein